MGITTNLLVAGFYSALGLICTIAAVDAASAHSLPGRRVARLRAEAQAMENEVAQRAA